MSFPVAIALLRSRLSACVALLIALLATGCGERGREQGSGRDKSPPSLVRATPLNERGVRSEADGPLFMPLEPDQTGVWFSPPIIPGHELRRLYATGMAAGGVAVGDVNGDALPDLFFAGGPNPNALYLQSSANPLRFLDVTESTGVSGGDAWATGCAIVDIDNDGDNDIFVCNYDSPNQLFLNQGGSPPKFAEDAKGFGLDLVDASHTPAFADYDRDGDLDLYLLTNRFHHPEASLPARSNVIGVDDDGTPRIREGYEKYFRIVEVRPGAKPGLLDVDYAITGRPDRLYRNELNHPDQPRPFFSDVTDSSGVADPFGSGQSVLWWDFNRDGNPDLFVGNEEGNTDRLFMNNGDGTFIDLAAADFPVLPVATQGAGAADLDGNGWPDLFLGERQATERADRLLRAEALAPASEFSEGGDQTTDAAPSSPPLSSAFRNVLLCNFGRGRFFECARQAGVAFTGWTWSTVLRDFDNDGLPDLFVATGLPVDAPSAELESGARDPARGRMTDWDRYTRGGVTPLAEPNLFLRNAGDFRFEDMTDPWLGRHPSVSMAAVPSDLDRDGDLDLVVVNMDGPPTILLNRLVDGNSFLVRLEGRDSPPEGIGATLIYDTEGIRRHHFVSQSGGFLGCSEPVIVCGLGNHNRAERLVVEWPSGRRQEIEDVLAHRLYTIREPSPSKRGRNDRPDADARIDDTAPPASTLFRESYAVRDAVHRERPFDDFSEQPLLPHRLSRLGPGVATGDINGDGRDDLVLGGAAGQAASVFVQAPDGTFQSTAAEDSVLAGAAESEDMGIVIFEANGDEKPDLYIVSGGNEHRFGQPELLDRLYLGDGSGSFSLAPPDSLPNIPESGSSAAAADFDRDGDLDLFVGGRVTPGKYPFAPANRLLVNDGTGVFTDATSDLAPDAAFTGMVTAVLWTDWNADGWIDLVAAHEWGPVMIFENTGGRLRDATPSGDGRPADGCWLSLATADVDRDGDLDLFAGNLGLNTPYRATPEAPAILLAGDLDGSGTMRLLEGVGSPTEELLFFPRRNRRELGGAIRGVIGRVGTARSFAEASLAELIPDDRLAAAEQFAMTETRSGVYLNDGDGRLRFVPLPGFGQLAPVRSAAFIEIDGDPVGAPDLVVTHNWRATRPGDEPFGGGCSVALTGLGDGSFRVMSPEESGIFINGDVASVARIDVGTDGRDDLLFGLNDEPARLFVRPTAPEALVVTLEGASGNPHAVGASVVVRYQDGTTSARQEVTGGGGGLAQSPPRLSVPKGPASNPPTEFLVRWPDGEESSMPASEVAGNSAAAAPPDSIRLRRNRAD